MTLLHRSDQSGRRMNVRRRAGGVLTAMMLAMGVVGCGSAALPAASGPVAGETITTAVARSTPDSSEPTVDDTRPGGLPSATSSEPPPAASTTDAGAQGIATADSWTDVTANLVGLESTCGNVSYVSAHPDVDRVFVGISQHGVWELLPDPVRWEPLGRSDGSAAVANRTSWFEYDPVDPSRFWESGSYGPGVFGTLDGGQSFRQLGEIDHIDRLSVDFSDPDRQTMLAGRHEASNVYLSTDGGRSWGDVVDRLPPDVGHASNPLVIDAETFLLGTSRSSGAGVFRSDDGGQSWTTVHSGGVVGAPLVDGQEIIWLSEGGGGLTVSRDGGLTFERTQGRLSNRAVSLLRISEGRLAALGSGHLAVSEDGGDTWQPLGPELPFVPHGLAFSRERSAVYAWQFSCDFSGGGNPVEQGSIVQLELELP